MPDEFDMYSEVALVSIAVRNDTAPKDWRFETLIDTIDIDTGDKDFEAMPNLAGGRLVKFNPQSDTTLTIEAYPVEAGTDQDTSANLAGAGFWDLQNTGTATEPQEIPVDLTRNKVRVAILFVEPNANLASLTAHGVVAVGVKCLRIVMADGYVTGAKPSFTDDELKWTITVKFPAFDRRGFTASDGHNILIQSSDGTAQLAALSGYTSSNKY